MTGVFMRRSRRIKYTVARHFSDLPKVRKNEILFVPSDNRILENPPWSNSSTKPEWWKRQDKANGSIRTCHGTNDFISLGVTLPMWTNVTVRPTPDGKDFELRADQFARPPESDTIGVHHIEGFGAFSVKDCPFSSQRKINGHYPKLVTPWTTMTAPGYSTLVLPTILEPFPEYTVMPGVVHTDYYHVINIVLIVNTDKQFTIPVGRPMYQLIPFKRSDGMAKVLEGDQSMHRFLSGRGTGEMYLGNHERKKSYKREQRKADERAKNR